MAAQIQDMEMILCCICGAAEAACIDKFICCDHCKTNAHRHCVGKAGRPLQNFQTDWLCEVCDTTEEALNAKPLQVFPLGKKIPASAMATGGRHAAPSLEHGEGHSMAALPHDNHPMDVDKEANVQGLDVPPVQTEGQLENVGGLGGLERVDHVTHPVIPFGRVAKSAKKKPIGALKPNGNGFVERRVTRAATKSFQPYYTAVWLTWRKVPDDARQKAWIHFKTQGRFYWEPQLDERVKECYMGCMRTRFRDMLLQERSRSLERAKSSDLNDAKKHNPSWIKSEFWVQLCDFWLQSGWQERSRKCSENRRKARPRPRINAAAAAAAAAAAPPPN